MCMCYMHAYMDGTCVLLVCDALCMAMCELVCV